jgi:hypothetical protein
LPEDSTNQPENDLTPGLVKAAADPLADFRRMDICHDPSGDYRTRDLLASLRDCSCGKHRILPLGLLCRACICCIRRVHCHCGRIIEFSRVRSAPNIPSIASMLFSAWDLDMRATGRRAQGKKCCRAYCDVYPPDEPGSGAAGADRVGPEHNSPAGFKARFADSFAFESSNSHVAQIVIPDSRFSTVPLSGGAFNP